MEGAGIFGLKPLTGIACSKCGTHTTAEGVCPEKTCWTNYTGQISGDTPSSSGAPGRVVKILNSSQEKSEIFDCLYDTGISNSELTGKVKYNDIEYSFILQFSTKIGKGGRKVLFEKEDIEIFIGDRGINHFEEGLISKISVASQNHLMEELFWKNDEPTLAQF